MLVRADTLLPFKVKDVGPSTLGFFQGGEIALVSTTFRRLTGGSPGTFSAGVSGVPVSVHAGPALFPLVRMAGFSALDEWPLIRGVEVPLGWVDDSFGSGENGLSGELWCISHAKSGESSSAREDPPNLGQTTPNLADCDIK